MGTNLMWWSAIALEGAVLFRGLRAALLKKYPVFYTYVACILLIELLRFAFYTSTPRFFQALYWHSELIAVVGSYGIIVEIFRKALEHNPGLARVAQKLLLVILVIAVSYAASDLLHGGFASLPRATADLGRYLKYVEGALLLTMLAIFLQYRISFGRNLLGMTLGYSLWVGLDVMNLALLSFPGNEFSVGLRKSLSIAYVITLVVWCTSLWSCQPDPVPPPESRIDRDYALLAGKTSAALAQLSSRIGRTLRP